MSALAIALAGAVGTLLRYGLTLGMTSTLGASFPWGTLAANVAGSFLLAVVAEAFSGATIAGTEARLVVGIGLLGGFTTYSSFNLETLRLLQTGAWGRAAAYLFATLVGCLVAGALGLAVARMISPAP